MIVHLTGGPGGVAILEVQTIVGAGFNRDRDLVVMDQRGTPYSEPALTCPRPGAMRRAWTEAS
jgi:hypothetical protein